MDEKKERKTIIDRVYYILLVLMKNNLNLLQGFIFFSCAVLLFAISSQEKSIPLKLVESFGGGALVYLSYESFVEHSKKY